jgi:hypothetical protein
MIRVFYRYYVIKRSPQLPPDLMSITQSLRKVVNRHSSNVVWNYLNKGTHEELENQQFYPLIVKETIKNLFELDNELMVLKKNKYGTVTV